MTEPSPMPPAAPFFSLAVACCDVAPYLEQCLDSILSQPFPDWECILWVEESRDATLDIARAFGARDPRFRVFSGPRTGSCSVSRNKGIELACGEYLLFLDGDDTLAPGALHRIRDRIAARPGADLYPGSLVLRHDEPGHDDFVRDNFPPDPPPELTGPEATLLIHRHCHNAIYAQVLSVAYRRSFLVDEALEFLPGFLRQDCDFYPRALYLARRVVPLRETFYIYRRHPGSASTSARTIDHFDRHWAAVLRSVLAFHARVSRDPDFDPRVADCWREEWLRWLFVWFLPNRVRSIPRAKRLASLSIAFPDGFSDLEALAAGASFTKRIACRWVERFLRHPFLRPAAERFFALYFALSKLRRR